MPDPSPGHVPNVYGLPWGDPDEEEGGGLQEQWAQRRKATKAEEGMKQPFEAKNAIDAGGQPAGGFVTAVGLSIHWQNGPLGRGAERQEPNGAFVETVLAAALQRLQFYQQGKFQCEENALAITHIEEALKWLETRTRAREARQVEGTHTI